MLPFQPRLNHSPHPVKAVVNPAVLEFAVASSLLAEPKHGVGWWLEIGAQRRHDNLDQDTAINPPVSFVLASVPFTD
jgi:hypothetical protein